MGKLAILAAVLAAVLVGAAPAHATTDLTTTCATTTLQWWTSGGTHDGHDIQQKIQPHGSSVYSTNWTTIATYSGANHLHAYYAKRPEAQKVKYRIGTFTNGGGEEFSQERECDLSSTIHFAAGAEFSDCYVSNVADCGALGNSAGEWAKFEEDLGGTTWGVESSTELPSALS